MREITLQEMLDARERRAFRQRALLSETQRPLISFCLNIPGPVKDSPLIRRGYREGVRRLDAALRRAGIPVSHREESLAPTGPELLLAADAEAEALKALCLEIEEADALYDDERNGMRASDGRIWACHALCDLIHTEGAQTLATYTDDFYAGMACVTVNCFGRGSA